MKELTHHFVDTHPEYEPLLGLRSVLSRVFSGSFWIFLEQGDFVEFTVVHDKGVQKTFTFPNIQAINHYEICFYFFSELTRKHWGSDMGQMKGSKEE